MFPKMFPKMLYKLGGTEIFEDESFTTLIVCDEDEHANAIKVGWFETIDEARKPPEKPAKKSR